MTRVAVVLALVAGVVLLAGGILVQDGAPWRIPEARRSPDTDALRQAESALCDESRAKPEPDPLVTCAREVAPDAPSIYVWGDSHARHLIGGLAQVYPRHNIRILYFTSCLAQSGLGPFDYAYEGRAQLAEDCRQRNRQALEMFESHAPTSVLLHQYFGYEGQFSQDWVRSTEYLQSTLASYGHHARFIGGVVQPGADFVNCRAVPATIPDVVLAKRCSVDQDLEAWIVKRNDQLAKQFPEFFINPNAVFCDADGACNGPDRDMFLFRDEHHLSIEGSVRLIESLAGQLAIAP